MPIFKKRGEEQKPKLNKGKLIVIDGPDGSGKHTQTKLLAQTLGDNDYEGVIFNFPQYTKASAVMIEKYLAGDYGTDLNAKAASIFYAIDRFDASTEIKDHLSKGRIVLADRYVVSNAGHQGAKIDEPDDRVSFYKWLDDLEYNIYGIPKPDLNIILHIPLETSMQLIAQRNKTEKRKTDIHESDKDHLKRAEAVYMELSQLIPNTKIIECVENGQLLSPQKVQTKVWELVRRIALK